MPGMWQLSLFVPGLLRRCVFGYTTFYYLDPVTLVMRLTVETGLKGLTHSPLLLRLPRFFHFCQIYAGQLFVDQPIEVALQGAINKNFITLL